MTIKRIAGIAILVLFLFMGCSGDYGIISKQT
jgi:hypothetical protein